MIKCSRHKYYRGRNIPKHIECNECWAVFNVINPHAVNKNEYVKIQESEKNKKEKSKLKKGLKEYKKQYLEIVNEMIKVCNDYFYDTGLVDISQMYKKYSIAELSYTTFTTNLKFFYANIIDKKEKEIKKFIQYLHEKFPDYIGKKWLEILKITQQEQQEYDKNLIEYNKDRELYSVNKIDNLVSYIINKYKSRQE